MIELEYDKINKMYSVPSKVWLSSDWASIQLFAVCFKGSVLRADSEDWSDWANAQAGQCLCWVHRSFWWFCHVPSQVLPVYLEQRGQRHPLSCRGIAYFWRHFRGTCLTVLPLQDIEICSHDRIPFRGWIKSEIYLIYEPSGDKTNNVAVRPAKTQISLGIHPVWSESSLGAHSLCLFCHEAVHMFYHCTVYMCKETKYSLRWNKY